MDSSSGPTPPQFPATPDRYGSATRASLVFVPALGTPARVYTRFGEALAAHGFGVLVVELRGVGRSAITAARGEDWGYAELVDVEVARAVATARETWPGQPLWLGGHSLGGHLALLHQARHAGAAADGLLLIASGTPHWRRYAGAMAWITRGFGRVVHAASLGLGYFPGHRLGFGGRQPASLMLDWASFLETGQPMARGWTDGAWRDALSTLQRQTLALHIPGDRYAPPASIADLLALTAIRAHVETANYEHSPGHFGWLKQPGPVVERIARRFADAV